MFVNADFTDLLKIFNRNNVKYLIIGGYAVIQYAEPRFTKDLDIWVSADMTNATAVYRSLREFGAPLTDLTESDFAEEGYFYQMGVPPIRIDILMSIPGLVFNQVWARQVKVDFDDLIVPFISREDLIIAKRASGRAQDLLDAELLSQAGHFQNKTSDDDSYIQ